MGNSIKQQLNIIDKFCSHWNSKTSNQWWLCSTLRSLSGCSRFNPKEEKTRSQLLTFTFFAFFVFLRGEKAGGFENESNIAYFVRFSEFVFKEYSSLVTLWCTVNEPVVREYLILWEETGVLIPLANRFMQCWDGTKGPFLLARAIQHSPGKL
jgi:hypothetical protein